ncbi:hypothetical protein BU17DRAFT_72049 [Hysterangium stoloniferum]|nr:hypothetical protein BU17DRAFT_72049 [Hysterangium stoloniferum]
MSIDTNSESCDYYLEADVNPCQLPREFSIPNVERYNLGASAVTQGSPTDSGDRALTAAEEPISPLNLDESPAQPSVSRKKISIYIDHIHGNSGHFSQIILTSPPTNTPRFVRNRPELPWASLVENISHCRDPLMVVTYNAEAETTPCHSTNDIENKYLEENIASRPRVETLTRARELGALSDANICSVTTSSSFPLAPTLNRSIQSESFAGVKMPDFRCIRFIQEDLEQQQCSFGHLNSQLNTIYHWLAGHLFSRQNDGNMGLSHKQLAHICKSLLRCPEENCHQQGGFFWKEKFLSPYVDPQNGTVTRSVSGGH